MPADRWLPRGFRLSHGGILQNLRFDGDGWQIYDTADGSTVLVADSELCSRWVDAGLLPEDLFEAFSFGSTALRAVGSSPDQDLAPLAAKGGPICKSDALSFAASLRATRAIQPSIPLHDGIFVERYSRILPTWSVSEACSDAELLGRWLSGGVKVPTTALRRLANLTAFLTREDLVEIVESAGALATGEHAGASSTCGAVAVTRQPTADADESRLPAGEARVISEGASAPFRLPGRPELETFFNEHVVDIVRNADRYARLGISFPSAVVLHGPPGCGKTFAVERLVDFLDWPVLSIDASAVAIPYVHETSRKIGEVFDKAMDAAPSAVIIDEMDAFLADRQTHSAGLHHVEEVAEFLRRVPEATAARVLVVGMTNRLEMIDSAILRRGRFDHIVEVGMPSADDVRALLEELLGKVPTVDGLNTASAIAALAARPLSDAAFVVRESGRIAAGGGKHEIDGDCLDVAIAALPATAPESRPIGFL